MNPRPAVALMADLVRVLFSTALRERHFRPRVTGPVNLIAINSFLTGATPKPGFGANQPASIQLGTQTNTAPPTYGLSFVFQF
jgi:hypothetical protein